MGPHIAESSGKKPTSNTEKNELDKHCEDSPGVWNNESDKEKQQIKTKIRLRNGVPCSAEIRTKPGRQKLNRVESDHGIDCQWYS